MAAPVLMRLSSRVMSSVESCAVSYTLVEVQERLPLLKSSFVQHAEAGRELARKVTPWYLRRLFTKSSTIGGWIAQSRARSFL